MEIIGVNDVYQIVTWKSKVYILTLNDLNSMGRLNKYNQIKILQNR
jgi:hypothetical protein